MPCCIKQHKYIYSLFSSSYQIRRPEHMGRMKMETFRALLLLTLISLTVAAPAADLITDLPGLNYTINFNQYSGYLNGTSGRNLHYWFVESQNDPANDPLLLWLNGGPGCSSLDGLLSENGPFKVADDGVTLVENIYSWNTFTNVIYLESPACVGFSYDTNNNCATDDDEVSLMNYLALQEFWAKFPEYTTNDFYITGESYAGVYIPSLSVRVVDGQATYPVNFKGYAIGNGLLSYENNEDSLMFFGYYHAILGQDLWNELVSRCCSGGVESKATCDFYSNVTAECLLSVLKATDVLYYQGLNMYNLYGDCESSSSLTTPSRYQYDLKNLQFRESKKQKPEPYLDPPCIDSSNNMNYLNQASVRTALHIPSFVQNWEICSDEANSEYTRIYFTMVSQLSYLQSSVRALIYNGDVDMAVNFLGNEWDVESLGFAVTESRTRWVADNDVAGYVIRYENLDFLTVRGSGHMVPEDKPLQALQMITAFINNQPY